MTQPAEKNVSLPDCALANAIRSATDLAGTEECTTFFIFFPLFPLFFALSASSKASYQRRTKGAIKLHLVLGHDGYPPHLGLIIEERFADIKVAQGLKFNPGTVIIDNRGYNDFGLFGKWMSQRSYFVTRMEDNAQYVIMGEWKFPQHQNISIDELVGFFAPLAQEKSLYPLR